MHEQYQAIYHRMPQEYRKHGDMPTQTEMFDDVDYFMFYAPSEISHPIWVSTMEVRND